MRVLADECVSSYEHGDGFDVGGLGEEVEQVEFCDAVAGGAECGEVGWQGFG